MASTAPLWKKVHELNLTDHDIIKSLDGGAEDFRRYMGREPNATGVKGIDRIRIKALKPEAPAKTVDPKVDETEMPRVKKTPLRSINDIRQRLNDLESYHLDQDGDTDQGADMDGDND